ncbi:hypothetical protein GCK72_013667 [Caenorhabditis remanei]|uniref:Uncharacterized protein n=1 Tax=Caenorhabditis remanei TaxID=31234 RepID=A0A6A5GS75_CAERE|nr:hypothetical protein GCK72_013667 [Caenorhabditis remanei]KAF1757212.1 hypothetical protein GCK72_013667 [Caenorhabditis remanei]
MKFYERSIIFLPILIGSCWAALPACANPGCPTGGIWSEWTTTDRCPTTCGSCSKAFHTRRCLTAEIECPCTGNDTRYYPCNTLACVYPAQRTCCIPYVPMIINGSMTCGPLPKDPVVTSCCPAGGLWSNWGGYVRNSENTAFERTRRCLSEEAGCNCTTGNSVNTNKLCPCASFVDTYDTYFKNGTDILYTTSYNRELNLTTCIFWSLLYKTSDACSNWEPYTSTNVIRYWKKDAINYTEYRMADCNDPANQYFRAYCDFKTGYYRFYNTDDEVLGWKQQCPSGQTCPIGGLWSEWATTGKCTSECGSCEKLYYTRVCLTENAGCNCTGDSSRFLPCNTQTCIYPAQRSCCIPFVPMVINGTMQCGPIPKDKKSSSGNSQCCPPGGIWSEWTAFGRDPTKTFWVQTRECVSEAAGCPCEGDRTKPQTACPCSSFASVENVASYCGETIVKKREYNVTITDNTCSMTASLVASNDDKYANCKAVGNYDYLPRIVFATLELPCKEDRPFYCEERRKVQSNYLPISFTCDLKELKWRYDYTGEIVNGFIQTLA